MSNILKLSPKELDQLRLVELELLVEVDRICRKNNINYSLSSGTLIGAVRHKGFIPWDDDLDVDFTHKEYERFFEACKKDLDTDRFFLQDNRTDPNYRWGYAKLRRLGTEYIKDKQEHLKQRRGIKIDLFEFIDLPNGKIKRKIFQNIMFCIRKTTYSEVGKYFEDKWIKRLWFRILSHIPMNIVHRLRRWISDKSESDNTERVSAEMFPWRLSKEGIQKKVFNDYVELEFENMTFMAVADYDAYLKTQYGNYMELPPIEKRQGVMDALKYEFVDVDKEELIRINKKSRGEI